MATIDEREYWDQREKELSAELSEDAKALVHLNAVRVRLAAMEADRGAVTETEIDAVRCQLAELEGEKPEKDQVLAKWAQIMGKTEAELQLLGNRWVYSRWESLPARKFSSPEAQDNFRGFMREWGEAVG